ncbi:MAG: ribonucleotide reductase N-terminal alpha domain-containing protein [Candidatus Syntropharchaeia archaeon]
MDLSRNALEVLKRRYLLKNDRGEIVETPSQMFRRVASTIGKADEFYGSRSSEDEFYELMKNLEFLPLSFPSRIPWKAFLIP